MRGAGSCAAALALVALASGCSSAGTSPEQRSRAQRARSAEAPSTESASTGAPSLDSKGPISQARRKKLDTFLKKVRFLDRVGPELGLGGWPASCQSSASVVGCSWAARAKTCSAWPVVMPGGIGTWRRALRCGDEVFTSQSSGVLPR